MTTNEIKILRKELKLSQHALAEKLGISRPQMSRMERGEIPIPTEILENLHKLQNNLPEQETIISGNSLGEIVRKTRHSLNQTSGEFSENIGYENTPSVLLVERDERGMSTNALGRFIEYSENNERFPLVFGEADQNKVIDAIGSISTSYHDKANELMKQANEAQTISNLIEAIGPEIANDPRLTHNLDNIFQENKPLDPAITLGEKIRNAREKLGYERRYLAELLNITSSHLTLIEQDERGAPLEILQKLKHICDMNNVPFIPYGQDIPEKRTQMQVGRLNVLTKNFGDLIANDEKIRDNF